MNKPLNDLTEQLMTEERTLKITALCKKAVIVIVDFILYFIANTAIVYLTMGGHVRSTEYSSILFSYWHLFITLTLLCIFNKLLDLYKSVWTFAGVGSAIPAGYLFTLIF